MILRVYILRHKDVNIRSPKYSIAKKFLRAATPIMSRLPRNHQNYLDINL